MVRKRSLLLPAGLLLACSLDREPARLISAPASPTAPPRFTTPAPPSASAAADPTRSAYFATLARAHAEEPRDPLWAGPAEERLQEWAASAEGGLGLDVISCRATLCRVELASAQQEAFVTSVAALFPEAALETRGLRTVAFLARDGAALPGDGNDERDGEDGERGTAEH